LRDGTTIIDRTVAALASAAAEDTWDLGAACRDEDPMLFFGPNRFEPKRERLAREAEAKAVCAGCPSLRACREYALSQGELYGVWGGLGENDRRTVVARNTGTMARSA
jgi:WhiB family transcriptional regulator, redox-sensing transcriptional regulator